jgi:glutamate-ammonia-ligase adenylyltransferase
VARVRREQLRDDVISMREKMRRELDRSDSEYFDLKHGRGGIGDIEFLVQYLVLDNAQAHPDVIYYSDNIRQLDALAEAGCIETAIRNDLQDAYRDYRLKLHHLVLDKQPPLVQATDFAKQRQFVGETWDAWLA